MSLSDCRYCWETPCICDDGYGYKHLSINELLSIKKGIDSILDAKMKRGLAPNMREHSHKGRSWPRDHG